MNEQLTKEQLIARVKKLEGTVKKLSSLVEEDKSSYKIDAPDLLALGSIDIKRLNVLNSTLRQLAASGLPFAKGGNINDVLSNVAGTFDRLTGNAEMGAKAVEALTKNYKQFAIIADGPTGAKMAEDFSNQAAALDRLGLGFGEYTKNMDLAMNMFNLTSDKVKSLNQGLSDFAKEMKMMPSVVSQNFQLVAKSLSYEAPKVAEQFQKMQRLSQQTGVSIGTFMGGMGDKLDTIGGAAQFTGQLNAILGRNVFSPNQILMMDEAERMVKIREVLQGSPIYNEIESGGKLGKFALNTISKLTGFSKEDTRKYILGKEGDGSLKTLMAAKAPGGRITGGETKAGDKLAAGNQFFGQGDAKKLNENLTNMANDIKNLYLSAQDRAFVEDRAALMGGRRGGKISDTMLRSLRDKSGIEFGTDAEVKGVIPGRSLEELSAARFRFPQVTELFRKLQTMPKGRDDQTAKQFRKQFSDILKIIGAPTGIDEKTMGIQQQRLNELLEASKKIGVPYAEGKYSDVDEVEQGIIGNILDTFGLKRRALREARDRDLLSGKDRVAYEGLDPEKKKQFIKDKAKALQTSLEETGLTPEQRKSLQKPRDEARKQNSNQNQGDINDILNEEGINSPKSGKQGRLDVKDIKTMIATAVEGMQFVINLGQGQPSMLVNAALKEGQG